MSAADDFLDAKPATSAADRFLDAAPRSAADDFLDSSPPKAGPSIQGPLEPPESSWGALGTGLMKAFSATDPLNPLRQVPTFSPEEKQSAVEKLPGIIAGAGLSMVPGASWLSRAIPTVATGAGLRGFATAQRGGTTTDIAKSAADPLGVGVDLTAGSLPEVVGGVSWLAKKATPQPVKDFLSRAAGGVADSASLGAAAEPISPGLRLEQSIERDIAVPELPQKSLLGTERLTAPVQRFTEGASRTLLKSSSPIAREAGKDIITANEVGRAIEAGGHHNVAGAIGELSEEEATQLGRYMGRSSDPTLGQGIAQASPDTPLNVVQAAERLKADVLDPIASMATKVQVQTRNPATGELYPFQRLPGTYFPRFEKAGDDLNPIQRMLQMEAEQGATGPASPYAVSRLANAPKDVVESAHEAMSIYVPQYARKISNAMAHGGPQQTIMAGGRQIRVGEKLAGQINALREAGATKEAEALESYALDAFGSPPSYGKALAQAVTHKASDVALGRSWLANFSQAGTPAWMLKPRDVVAGLKEWRNPAVREAAEFGGATQSGLARQYLESGATQESLPMRLLNRVEGKLRGPLSAGFVAQAKRLGREFEGKLARGQELTAADRFLAAEMGTTPERLAKGLTPKDIGELMQAATRVTQFHGGPGEAGSLFRNPVARLAGSQWQLFSKKQSELVSDHLFGLLRSPDASLRALGRERLRRFVVAQPVASTVGTIAKSVAGGRLPSLMALSGDIAGGGFGMGGDLAMKGYRTATGNDEYGGMGGIEDLGKSGAIASLLRLGAGATRLAGGTLGLGADPLEGLAETIPAAGLWNPNLSAYTPFASGVVRGVSRSMKARE